MSRKYGKQSNHSFAQIPAANIPRSQFDRSRKLSTSFDGGQLIPIFIEQQILPGDTLNVNMTLFARLATPLHPFLDNIKLQTFFFAVPIRLIWDNWHKFNGAQDNPGDSTSFLIPQMVPAAGHQALELADYLGIPPDVPDITHSSLPFRAYNLIWNEWFRAEDIQNSITVDTDDGPDTVSNYPIQNRNKRHDYFTSALPWPQKGDAIQLPLGTSAPIYTDAAPGDSLGIYSTNQTARVALDIPTTKLEIEEGTNPPLDQTLYADLSTATAATINELREAYSIQGLQERDARGGTRYTEILRSHFGVTSPDQRLQRPEFLGGGSQDLNIQAIPQTSETGTTDQGSLAGVGVSVGAHSFVKSFTEHCIVLGLVCATAPINYQQGLHRDWNKRTRFDHFWPDLQNLGEQAIENKELFVRGSDAVGWVSTTDQGADTETFGFQERWAEYRYADSLITGLMRSSHATSLDVWHLAQDFGDPAIVAAPTLGDTFISEDPPIDRVIATPAEPHFLCDGHATVKHARPMSTYSVPGRGVRF